ncbi:hypothetical protein [Caulobacter sp. DWR3-1-2]|uniref:hypothetical protein n=1 Tax=Caulobacter sp. DWR3-1-2 TaxID=2804647 RepID=UPI003CEE7BBD
MSTAFRPVVVAIGHSRPDALARLLASLGAGAYPPETPLVISLDHCDQDDTAAVTDAFTWAHVPKRVIRHAARLGLREHILRCGDLAVEYGGPSCSRTTFSRRLAATTMCFRPWRSMPRIRG